MSVVLDAAVVEMQSRLFEQSIRSYVMTEALSFEQAYKRVASELAGMASTGPAAQELIEQALARAWARIREEQKRVEFYTKCSLQAGRVAWYNGPSEGAEEWNRLVGRLRALKRSDETIRLVDEESTAILNLIDNPGKQRFSTRGLVVGYVQSGKTGNMAAVLAKAAGTPFKFFIVLSGMTDSLRNQTQKRLDADILNDAIPGRWHRQTRADTRHADGTLEKGDFTFPAGGAFQLHGETRHLAVMKKNAGVLRRFLRTLQQTPRALLEETPFLLIDDECDQASVNSSAYDDAVTVINDLIRRILAELPRVAYVGYTATPYANVLINTSQEDDLYPRDFIHALSKPEGYFGAEELFGRAALEGDASREEQEGVAMIRSVAEEDIPQLRPLNKATPFEFAVAPSLDRAIRYFILCLAAKEDRGLGGEHASMLVHTSMLTVVHEQARVAIEPHLRQLASRLARGDDTLLAEMRELWHEETAAVPAEDFGLEAVPFARLVPRLAACAASIETKVENWTSTDRIDYDRPGRRYLVIGGNVLARGLTLEGLMVSLFMRTSSQYDTLMQMGRWFGYRRGFEDLPRIWMEDSIRSWFFELATVEEEIRRDIRHYALHNVTPREFAVRIRKVPGLMITNRNRLRHTRRAQIGYAGRHLQTIRFRRADREWLARNWDAGGRLLQTAARTHESIPLFTAGHEAILRFLDEYSVHPDSSGLNAALLSQFIRQSAALGELYRRWHVGVIATDAGKPIEAPLGPLQAVRCNNRSAMRGGGDSVSIKALMSKRDLLFDMGQAEEELDWDTIKERRLHAGMPPLLLLYPIDRNSQPQQRSGDRVALAAAHDVLGFGIMLAGDPETSHDYVTTNLTPVEADEEPMDEIAQELLEG